MISMRENLLDALFHMKVVRIELGLSKNSVLPFCPSNYCRCPVLIVTPVRPHKHLISIAIFSYLFGGDKKKNNKRNPTLLGKDHAANLITKMRCGHLLNSIIP